MIPELIIARVPSSQDSAYPRLPSDNFFFCAAGASETSIHERAVQARPSYAYSVGTHLLVLGTRLPVLGTRLPVPGTRLPVLGTQVLDCLKSNPTGVRFGP